MNSNKIDEAYKFEAFISRANKKMSNEEFNMKGIMYYELGLRSEINEKQYNKELLSVKNKLTKAIDKFLKRKLKVIEYTQLEELKPKIELCKDSDSLISIINLALAITSDYRDF